MPVPPLRVVAAAPGAVIIPARASVRILREDARTAVFPQGRFQKAEGPGLLLLMPFVREATRVDPRMQAIGIPGQDAIPHDNVSMKVDAALDFNGADPERTVIRAIAKPAAAARDPMPGSSMPRPGSRPPGPSSIPPDISKPFLLSLEGTASAPGDADARRAGAVQRAA